MPSIRARIDQALDLVASFVRIAHRIAIFLIVCCAFLLSLLAFQFYPLAILPVVVVAAVAILYVNGKKDAISELIEDADEETALTPPDHEAHSLELPKRIVLRVLDQVLGSASDTAMLMPLVCVGIAVVAFGFGYNTVGGVVVFIGTVLFLLVSCSCHLAKYVTHGWVEELLGDGSDEHSSNTETTPLLNGRKP